VVVLVSACVTAPPVTTAALKETTPNGKDTLVIEHVRVFDGQDVLPEVTVLVVDGGVFAVGVALPVPQGATVVDGKGKTLLPGFIDSHVHVSAVSELEECAQFGVTTVLDMGCQDPKVGVRLRTEANAKGSAMADIRFAGYAVTSPGGHCTEYGIPAPTITQPEDAQTFIDARLSEGSEFIKIVYDDVKAFGLSMPTISKPVLKAAIDATHARGRLAIVHIGSLEGAVDAIALGADGLAHVFSDRLPDKSFSELLTAHRAFVVPTLSVDMSTVGRSSGVALLADSALATLIPPHAASNLKQSFPVAPGSRADYAVARETIRLLHDAGVPVLAGTDAPNPGTTYGATLHGELDLLVEAGLTPVEALAAATSRPAAQFHLGDRGRITKGLRADLQLVEGDPTTNIKATRNIVAVWRGGVLVDRVSYLAKLDAERAAERLKVAAPPPPGSETGLISDFDDLTTSARFGAGWAVSTDSLRGGKSTAQLKALKRGAHKSKGALEVSGEIAPGLLYAWGGVMFSPGERPMAPANLSEKHQLVFSARGDGAKYEVLFFTESRPYGPVRRTFTAGREWAEFSFSFTDLDGLDGHDLAGIAFVGGPTPGSFRFQLDDVWLR
jgi:imidazolonepropionase-like amidohydrolase